MTAQTPDRLWLDGGEWQLLATPLDPFLAEHRLSDRFVAPHSANWRGYLATWRIDEHGWLVLDDVVATLRGLASGTETISGTAVLGGRSLPIRATWFTGEFRVARGDQVRHVHAGFESVWADQRLVKVAAGRVESVVALAATGAMGAAGPYRLTSPLLGELTGGGFGQLVAAEDLDGRPLVAKLPLPHGGRVGRTEMWSDASGVRRPVHLPAVAFEGGTGRWHPAETTGDQTAAILRTEAELLDRDGGCLLPKSFGLWRHEPSGLPVLVMERLEGRHPDRVEDVVATLEALSQAVARGSLDHHGDLKTEHIFVADSRVRICDPAPRFAEPGRRAFTPMYNPRGYVGPAADVAACATILRYLPAAGAAGWRWCAAVLESPAPPVWVHNHRAALAELLAELSAAVPAPPGWQRPPLPPSLGQFSPPVPSSYGPPVAESVSGLPTFVPSVEVMPGPAPKLGPRGEYGFVSPAWVGYESVAAATGRGEVTCSALRESYAEAIARVTTCEGNPEFTGPESTRWRWHYQGTDGASSDWLILHAVPPFETPGFRNDQCPPWTRCVLERGNFQSAHD